MAPYTLKYFFQISIKCLDYDRNMMYKMYISKIGETIEIMVEKLSLKQYEQQPHENSNS